MILNQLPPIIQGGMGIAVSNWKLARTVSQLGQIGVVSGTAINTVLIRRLQNGDPDESMRTALAHFPDQSVVESILSQYFIPGGKSPQTPYKLSPMFHLKGPISLWQLTAVASFVEVWLAKRGHDGLVGINLLEKVQLPNLPTLFGAMLAHVDLVLMGAGIPREIPKVLDDLSRCQKATLKIHVENGDPAILEFDPQQVFPHLKLSSLKRPLFFPIVSSAALALNLKRKAQGSIEGFVVEGPKAGGHNAPPRGSYALNELGEPIYGPRDQVDPQEMLDIGLPFYFAGGVASLEQLQFYRKVGAQGIQVGTLFAFSIESGLDPRLRELALKRLLEEPCPDSYGWVYTDLHSSPTGFPFKALKMKDSLAYEENYLKRQRICDLGYLRHLYQTSSGTIGYRCPAEPERDWIKKEGKIEATRGKKCLCNALCADVGLGQYQKWGAENYLLTSGDDFSEIKRLLKPPQISYTAKDVIDYLLGSFSYKK